MPPDRRWTDADEQLAARAITAVYAERKHSPLGMARAVLDALTADGWRREADVRQRLSSELAAAVKSQLNQDKP